MDSRRRWCWCLAALLGLAALGMGVGEGRGPASIPEPRRDFRAAVTDVEGTRVGLHRLALAGQTFLLGRRGKGQVAVPLDKLDSVRLVQKEGRLAAHLRLRQGGEVELEVDPGTLLTGRTEYGNFQIRLGQVAEIELLEKSP